MGEKYHGISVGRRGLKSTGDQSFTQYGNHMIHRKHDRLGKRSPPSKIIYTHGIFSHCISWTALVLPYYRFWNFRRECMIVLCRHWTSGYLHHTIDGHPLGLDTIPWTWLLVVCRNFKNSHRGVLWISQMESPACFINVQVQCSILKIRILKHLSAKNNISRGLILFIYTIQIGNSEFKEMVNVPVVKKLSKILIRITSK